MSFNINIEHKISIYTNKHNLDVFTKEKHNVKIYLKGIIYNNLNDLILEYLKNEFNFVDKIDGSYLIIIQDNREKDIKLHVITDRTNSLKFFYAKTEEGWQVTDDIDLFNKNKYNLNPQAIACYIANGNMLNGLTLLKNVFMSEGAYIYTFENGDLKKEKYWDIYFNYGEGNSIIEKKIFKQELKIIIENSVKQKLSSVADNLLVSLSAGYDARSILGLIKKINPQEKVDTFTYRPTDKIIKDSDADISERISKEYANMHYGLKSFHGDFISILKLNAKEGKCIANFCDELDAIKKLADKNKHTDIFTGDEWFGRLDVPLNSNTEILDSVSIVGSWGIKWLEKIFNENKYNNFINELDLLTYDILAETKRFSNQHDKKDYLYLQQRVNHVNLTWREYFTSQIGFVHNPYLSNSILDFYQKIPPESRIEKQLFIEVITEMLPDIFEIPIANERRSLSGINYTQEIIKNKDKLTKILNENSSYVETLISKEEILKAINLLKKENDSTVRLLIKKLKKGINASRRIIKLMDILLHPILGPRAVKTPGSDKIVLRLLLLWIYLIKQPTE